jgi:hypothetical protein
MILGGWFHPLGASSPAGAVSFKVVCIAASRTHACGELPSPLSDGNIIRLDGWDFGESSRVCQAKATVVVKNVSFARGSLPRHVGVRHALFLSPTGAEVAKIGKVLDEDMKIHCLVYP